MAALTDSHAVRVSLVPSLVATESPPLTLAPGEGDSALRWLDAEHTVLEPKAPDGSDGSDGARPVPSSVSELPGERILLLPLTSAPDPGVLRREVLVRGWRIEVDVEPAGRAALRERARRGRAEAGHSGPTEVHAIIPGVVVSVSVTAGDRVVAGQELLTIEAMKMQNELRAPRDGTIERVAVAPGRTIDVGDLLVVII